MWQDDNGKGQTQETPWILRYKQINYNKFTILAVELGVTWIWNQRLFASTPTGKNILRVCVGFSPSFESFKSLMIFCPSARVGRVKTANLFLNTMDCIYQRLLTKQPSFESFLWTRQCPQKHVSTCNFLHFSLNFSVQKRI